MRHLLMQGQTQMWEQARKIREEVPRAECVRLEQKRVAIFGKRGREAMIPDTWRPEEAKQNCFLRHRAESTILPAVPARPTHFTKKGPKKALTEQTTYEGSARATKTLHHQGRKQLQARGKLQKPATLMAADKF